MTGGVDRGPVPREVPTGDRGLQEAIERLVAEQHELRTRRRRGPLEAAEGHRLQELGESLDQYWDLMRQRRARREFGQDPDEVGLRDREILKHYRQ